MKKIVALVVVVLNVICLCSCDFFDKIVDNVASVNEALIPKGSISGNTYSSGFSNLRFTKPDGWEYASDKELAQMFERGISGKDYGSFVEGVTEMSMRIDMYAKDPIYGSNINIMYQNLDLLNMSQSVDEYRATIETQVNEQTDGDYVRLSDREITLCGETYHKQEFSYQIQDVDIIQIHYFCIKDGILELITVGYAEGMITTEEIEEMFG